LIGGGRMAAHGPPLAGPGGGRGAGLTPGCFAQANQSPWGDDPAGAEFRNSYDPEPAMIRKFNPLAMVYSLWRHHELIWQLAKREVQDRYRATYLGLFWSVLTPLVLLVIYTFVFAVVFRARWSDSGPESRSEFALTMFCGMLLFNLFSEVVNRSPSMVTSNPNYVKRVVFPLEVFVVSGLLSALFNLLVGTGVWLLGMLLLKGIPPLTVFWLPIVLLPVCLTTAGIAWFLASLGVFIRDVSHSIVLVTQVLFFITPVFYSIQRVPQPFRRILEINPLSHSVDDARRVMMHGLSPEWVWWVPTLAASAIIAALGYGFFMKSKRAFADVI
jgi:lipopolysaccharide transport system permease protein